MDSEGIVKSVDGIYKVCQECLALYEHKFKGKKLCLHIGWLVACEYLVGVPM